jgi:hypothetical protein
VCKLDPSCIKLDASFKEYLLSSVSTSICDVNVLYVFINWRKIVLREVKLVKLQRRWKLLGFCSSVAEVFVGLPWTPYSLWTGEQTCLL